MEGSVAQQEKQKIEIEIIGGRFDHVTTVLEEFEPGDERFIHSYEKIGITPRKIGPLEQREVEVNVPSRLHPTELEYKGSQPQKNVLFKLNLSQGRG